MVVIDPSATSPAPQDREISRRRNDIEGQHSLTFLHDSVVANRTDIISSHTQHERPGRDGSIEALQSEEAEMRRREEETALLQAASMVRQKIRACRQRIFASMQRLQVQRTTVEMSIRPSSKKDAFA
jgi:hypothetical protein